MPPEASSFRQQRKRWPRLRSTARHPGFLVRTWRSGPLSAFRMRFDSDSTDAIQQLHVWRVSLGRGGEGLFEGFTDGVRYKMLREDWPFIVVAWWPSEAELRRREVDQLSARAKRLRGERDAARRDYAEIKTYLYGRIDTLRERAERAEQALGNLADIHHRTKVGSKMHDAENRDWRDCDCRTCVAAHDVIGGTVEARIEGAEELEMLTDAD